MVRKWTVTIEKSFTNGAVSCGEAEWGWKARLQAEMKIEVRLQRRREGVGGKERVGDTGSCFGKTAWRERLGEGMRKCCIGGATCKGGRGQ